MKNKWIYTRKWLVGFIGIMIFLTLSSNTILYFLTPKVRVEQVTSGSIKDERKITEIELVYTKQEGIRIPIEIQGGLYIEDICVYEGEQVQKGDPIISFNKQECERVKRDFEKRIIVAQARCTSNTLKRQLIEQSYKDQVAALGFNDNRVSNQVQLLKIQTSQKAKSRELEALEEEIKVNQLLYEEGAVSKNDLMKLTEKKEQLVEEMKILEAEASQMQKEEKENKPDPIKALERQKEEQLLQLENEEVLTIELAEIKDQYEQIKPILDTCQIRASEPSIIEQINVKDHVYYNGKELLAEYVPLDSPVRGRAHIPEEDKVFWETIEMCMLLVDGEKVPVTPLGINKEQERYYMNFKFLDDQPIKNDGAKQLMGITKAKAYSVIIPPEALFGDSVYVLRKEEKGFLGNYYYIDKVKVEVGEATLSQVGIISGMNEGVSVVTYWDRELKDKQRVMLEIP